MNKTINNFVKNFFTIILAIFSSFLLLLWYYKLTNYYIETWYMWAMVIYFIESIIFAFIILLFHFLFIDYLFKVQTKRIILYFLILFITIFCFILLALDIVNPVITFLFYPIWLFLYWMYLYLTQKPKSKNMKSKE
jgi:hypothetical protein